MAENESLCLGKARRWQPVLQAIEEGKSTQEVVLLVQRCLYQTLRAVRTQIPLADLLEAACTNPDRLPDLIRKCQRGRDYARLFQGVARPGASRVEILGECLRTITTMFLDQIRGQLVTDGAANSSAQILREQLQEVQQTLEPDARRIASKLAADPDAKIRMPPSPRKKTRREHAREMLGQKLLEVQR